MRIAVAALSCVLVLVATPGSRAAAVPGADVSFILDSDGGIAIPVSIGPSGPFRFVLDTGSSHSVIADTLVERLALPLVARSEMITSAGTTAVAVAEATDVAVGDVTAARLLPSILPLADLRRLGPGVEGVLGQDFLAAHDFTLDYEHTRLIWEDTRAGDVAGNAVRLTLLARDGRLVVTLPQPDTAPLHLVPDTGASAIVLYEQSNPLPLVLSPVPAIGGTMLTSLAGMRGARLMRLHALRVGTLTLRDRIAVVVPPSSAVHRDLDGLLPLHDFRRVSFRPGERSLVIEP